MQVIAVTGGKGGVGKTNVAVNLASALSKAGKDVLLLDADLGMANVDVVMGLHIEFTLADVVSGNKTVEEIVVKSECGVRVIPAASGIPLMAELTSEMRASLIHGISSQIDPPDILIVDTGAGIDETVQTFVSACQQAIVVVCDEPASLTDAYALIKVLRLKKNYKEFQVVVNNTERAIQAKQLFERLSLVTEKHLDTRLSYLGQVPQDRYLRRAVQERRPLVTAYPRSPAALAITEMAGRILEGGTERGTSGLTFFFEQLLDLQADRV